MRPRTGVGIVPRWIGFEGGPINEARMVFADEDGPLIDGKMMHPRFDCAVFIDVTFRPAFAVGVSASIHRIGEDMMQRGVGGGDPADLPGRAGLLGEGQVLRAEPKPDAARRTELGETLEDSADGADDRCIRMKQDFTILFSPNKADRQAATQLSASGLVANAAVEPGTNDM
jgi:hypothetical protein